MIRQACPFRIEIHDDHFLPDATDEYLLSEIGKRRWVFLSKDKRIRYRYPALLAIKQHNARFLFLTGRGDRNADETAAIILKAINRIERFNEKHKPPYIGKIASDGKISGPLPF